MTSRPLSAARNSEASKGDIEVTWSMASLTLFDKARTA